MVWNSKQIAHKAVGELALVNWTDSDFTEYHFTDQIHL